MIDVPLPVFLDGAMGGIVEGVAVEFGDRIARSPKSEGDFVHVDQRSIFGESAADGLVKVATGNVADGLEVGDLAGSMDASIRSSRPIERDLVANDPADSLFDRLLNRSDPILPLPAVKICSVIRQ